jgi:general secretion pathway protein D
MTRILLVLLTCGACLIASTSLPAAQTGSSSASSSTAEQAAREELVRRQEAQLRAQKLMTEGEKLYYAGKYEEAIAKLGEAIKLVPRAPATEIDYNRALHGLTDSYTRLADAAFHDGEYAKARQYAQKSLEYDPQNRSAEDTIIKARRAEAGGKVTAKPTVETGPALDQTPEFVAKKDQIKRLFREGKILMNSGQYDEAEKRFQTVLVLDPYNEDALALLKSLNKERISYAQASQDETRVFRLWEVSDHWTPPISHEVRPPKTEPGPGTIGSEALRQQKIIEKLNKIIIPEINYREAVVSDVITFLSEESRRLDVPDHVGVNIVLSSGIAAPAPAAATAATPPAPATPTAEPGAAPTAPTAGAAESSERKITLSLRSVPLIDALKFVTTLANLKFRVESSAVIVLPIDAPAGDLVTRTYPVSPGAFKTVISSGGTATTSSSGRGQGQFVQLGTQNITTSIGDVKALFTEAGVPFPTGSSLVYNERTSTIIIRNTPENIEIFERVLSGYNLVPSQIEIEAKFVEISQSDLDELGFDWQVGTKQLGSFDVTGGTGAEAFPPGSGANPNGTFDVTSGLRGGSVIQGNAIDALLAGAGFGSASSTADQIGTIRGILTDPQFQLVIKALSQKQSADTLSSPKVTTVSGAQAVIRVVQEFIYPTEFTAPTVSTSGGGTGGSAAAGVTPSTPGSFQTREVGVLLNVTPTVGADGYTINLTLAPEVSQFLGFINYGSPIGLASGNNVVTVANDIKEPLFSSQNLQTSVVLWDGQTVVLGGFITEQMTKIDDKVPFLGDLPMVGRLFRSKVTQRSKRNLLIFVTARLIDPAGNPIHRAPLTASAR